MFNALDPLKTICIYGTHFVIKVARALHLTPITQNYTFHLASKALQFKTRGT